MKKNIKHNIENLIKYLWLAATIALFTQAIFYTRKFGFDASLKFYILGLIALLFFLRRQYLAPKK